MVQKPQTLRSAYQDAFEVDVIFLGGLLVLLQDDVCQLGNVVSYKAEKQMKPTKCARAEVLKDLCEQIEIVQLSMIY